MSGVVRSRRHQQSPPPEPSHENSSSVRSSSITGKGVVARPPPPAGRASSVSSSRAEVSRLVACLCSSHPPFLFPPSSLFEVKKRASRRPRGVGASCRLGPPRARRAASVRCGSGAFGTRCRQPPPSLHLFHPFRRAHGQASKQAPPAPASQPASQPGASQPGKAAGVAGARVVCGVLAA